LCAIAAVPPSNSDAIRTIEAATRPLTIAPNSHYPIRFVLGSTASDNRPNADFPVPQKLYANTRFSGSDFRLTPLPEARQCTLCLATAFLIFLSNSRGLFAQLAAVAAIEDIIFY
jgi:hypothetical protein